MIFNSFCAIICPAEGFIMKVNSLIDLEHFTRYVQKRAAHTHNKERLSKISSMVGLLQDKKMLEIALENITKIEAASLKRGESVTSGHIFEAKKIALSTLDQITSSLSQLSTEVFPDLDLS